MIVTTFFFVLIIIFCYFLGSISNAVLICKFFHLIDPRTYGSKNPGATNIFRIAGYKLACGVALLDFLKGAVPVFVGIHFNVDSTYLQIIAVVICIGHVYPMFFQFRGGKGVATAFGSLTAISLNFFVVMIISWILVVFLFRYISLGSIITAIIIPFYVWLVKPQYLFGTILLSSLILLRHIDNIKRLYYNQEQKI